MKKERTGKGKRRRIFAVFLCMCILFTTQPEIWDGFSVFAAGKSDTRLILSFAELPEGVREQKVSVGTGREELELPEELTVFIGQEENTSAPDTEEADAGETNAEEDSTAENNSETGETQESADGESTEEPEGITDSGESVESEVSTESGESAETDGSTELGAEQAVENLPAENDIETSTKTVTVELEEYYAEPEAVTVYTLGNSEKGMRQIQETVAGVTWQSDPEYDGNGEETYTFTAVLPEGYALAEDVSLPQITVTVKESESGADFAIQTLLDRIAALPEVEEYLAAEPDMEDEDAYAEWEEKLYGYAGEALAIWEEYEALTGERQTLIAEEELAKLMAWVDLAETAGESERVMVVDDPEEQFPTLIPGETYWFDMSGAGLLGSVNQGNEFGAVPVPDMTLHWVPFTYVGTIHAYVLNRNSVGELGASEAASQTTDSNAQYGYTYDHSLFIADYNLTDKSWWLSYVLSDNNGTDLIFGTPYTSGGVSYTMRVPTMGSDTSGTGANQRGTPGNNEWDVILDKGGQAYDNDDTGYIKNWNKRYSWGQDTFTPDPDRPDSATKYRAVRGLQSARYGQRYVMTTSFPFYRPVLELPSPDTLSPHSLKIVTLDVGFGNAEGAAGTMPEGPYKIVVRSDMGFEAPNGEGLSAPAGKAFGGWKEKTDEDTVYLAGDMIPATVTELVPYWVEAVPPSIKSQPEDREVGIGEEITFSVTVEGIPAPTCQWQRSSGSGWVDISGAKESDYSTKATIAMDGWKYRCVVTNSAGSVTSEEAALTIKRHTVTYDYGTNGGNSATKTSAEVPGGEAVDLKPKATKDGWDFVGWNTDQNAQEGLKTLRMGEADVTLYAIYKKTLTASFYSGNAGSKEMVSTTVYNKEAYGNVIAPAMNAWAVTGESGYEPFGWSSGQFSGDIYYPGGTVQLKVDNDQNGSFYGRYKKSLTISYDANGGSGSADSQTTTRQASVLDTVAYKTTASITLNDGSSFSRGGYAFSGWIEGGSGSKKPAGATVYPAADTVYYVNWELIHYGITYELDGGEVTDNPISYTVESSTITLNNPTKAGYTFTGWSGTGLTGNNNKRVTIETGSIGNRTYTANWELESYTVTLHKDGGIGGADLVSYTFGTGAVLPTDWTKTGYVFDGWYDNVGCTGTAVTNISATDTGDKEYWAKWTDNIAPVIGTLNLSYQPKNFWQWLIGKDSLIITVPVTEEGSGADEITYTVIPDGGTAKVETSTIQNGAAKITVSADFKGTISIACTDQANNTSASVTVGAGVAPNGIIIEDHAPQIAFKAENAELLPSGEYKTVPNIVVTVADDKDNAISGGIASVSYQINGGSVKAVPHDYTASMVVSDSFTIQADEIMASGIPADGVVISVTATDNAGNSNTDTYIVKVHTHSGTLVPAVEPTCTTAGNKQHYTCTCGKLFSDSSCTAEITEQETKIAALGHDFAMQKDQSEHWQQCSRCSLEQSRAPHVYDNDTDTECNVCGYVRTLQGHTHSGTLVAAKPATCTQDGNEAYYTCSCGKWFTDSACTKEVTAQDVTIPAKGHTAVTDPAKAATCTETGLSEGSHCSVCGHVIKAQTVTAALGHDYSGNYHYDADGHWRSCSRCNAAQTPESHVFDDDNDATCNKCNYQRTIGTHTHSGTLAAATEPTCTLPGNIAYYSCSSCGKLFSDSGCTAEITEQETKIAALGHDFAMQKDQSEHWQQCSRCSLEQSRAPHVYDNDTDTECNVCGYVRTLQGHTHSGTLVAAKPAACTQDGNEAYYTCSCGKWFTDSTCTKEVTAQDVTIPAKGHTAVTDPAKAATCTETGLSEGSHCSVCGHVIKAQTVTAALGHDYSGNYHYDADGHWKVCSRCGTASAKQSHNYDNDSDTMCNDCDWVRTISDNNNEQDEQPPVPPTPQPPVPPTPQPPSPTNPPEQSQPTEKPDNPGTVPGIPEDEQEPESTGTPEPTEKPSETAKEQQPEGDGEQIVPASTDNGKIAISGEPVATGNVEGMTDARTVLKLEDGAVIVTVVCAEQEYTAGVADTLAVANAVLTLEQIQLVNNGETIELRINVKDISDQVPEHDKEVIENGIEEYRKEVPGLVLGMYVDISMFIRIGEGDWNAITEAEEPVEIIIGIPEKLQEKDRAYYIIRAHDGVSAFMNDMDNEPSTITVSTDLFSSYAIAYVQAEGAGHKCSLCHICPTFLGICYFVWLAIIILVMIVVIILLRKKKENQGAQDTGQ